MNALRTLAPGPLHLSLPALPRVVPFRVMRLLIACGACAVGLVVTFSGPAAQGATLRAHGSPVVGKPVAAAVPLLRQQGIEVKVTTEPSGGSSAGISSLGAGSAEVALSTRGLNSQDRAEAPARGLTETEIGFQALALVVARDVWESGVRAISREQVRGIYEGKITTWKALGGEDRAIKFYNPAQGDGTWEFFVTWVYGEVRKAPLGEEFERVSGAEETRNSVEFNAGSLSVVPPKWVDGKGTFALGIRDERGAEVAPTIENIRTRSYPLTRPLLLITAGRPAGEIRRFVEFMRGPEGQELVKKSDFIPAVDAPSAQ
jgi:phosphate transport system substrate-binding protein